MHTPRAIETRYSGYRFRSRLEARWAVFFDALGLKWEYEPEGFELPSGRYLPDFWLPESRLWVEVKPIAPTDGELSKCMDLAMVPAPDGEGVARVLIVEGPPVGLGTMIVPWGSRKPCPSKVSVWNITFSRGEKVPPPRIGRPAVPEYEIFEAVDAAKGARFEHGESGARR